MSSRSSKNEPPKGVTTRINLDGKENPKYIDLLDEDAPVAGQKFVCVSFISPEKIIKQREMFMFENFLNSYDYNKSLTKFNSFMGFISYKYNLKLEDLQNDLTEFVKEEKDELQKSTLEDDYKTYLDQNEDNLQEEFNDKYQFQTSVRGLKVRGSYPNQQEAELRCKMLREIDPNHDVFVGPVGMWMPYHPEYYKTGHVEYMEDELNQLMHEKDKNEKKAKVEFEQRLKETKKRAIEENIKNAEESGNVLTQNIDKDGQLVGISSMNTNELSLLESEQNEVSSADIKKELFEGDNIVVGKSNYGIDNLNVDFKLNSDDNTEEKTEENSDKDKQD
jgi:hypothetical protein